MFVQHVSMVRDSHQLRPYDMQAAAACMFVGVIIGVKISLNFVKVIINIQI
jgi:hypothetical protein